MTQSVKITDSVENIVMQNRRVTVHQTADIIGTSTGLVDGNHQNNENLKLM